MRDIVDKFITWSVAALFFIGLSLMAAASPCESRSFSLNTFQCVPVTAQ